MSNITIWKYPLTIVDMQTIEVPHGSIPLSVHTQHGCPCLWIMVNTSLRKETFVVQMFGTGHELPEHSSLLGKFVGTFLVHGDSLVFHVFVRPKGV